MKKWAVLGLALLFGAALVGAPSPAAAELKVGVSGYVKLDVQYNDKIFGLANSPAGVPLDTNKEADNAETILDARQTRVRVNASDEVAGVKLSSSVEGDFFTGDGNAVVSNSRHLRLRHAWARADHPSGFYILAGQTWSTFMNTAAGVVPVVDFNGPAGQLFTRAPQLKIGVKTGELVIEGAIEKQSTANLGAASVDESQGSGQDLPRLVGKVLWLAKMFKAEVAGVITKNRVILAGGKDEDDTGAGFQVSAEANFAPVTVYAHYQFLKGVGGLGNGDFGTQVVLFNNQVESLDSNGFYVGASLALTKDTSINGVFGWNELDDDAVKFGANPATTQETQQSIHVNILHKFWQRWQAGLEYQRIDVETFSGAEGDVNIVHGALFFFF